MPSWEFPSNGNRLCYTSLRPNLFSSLQTQKDCNNQISFQLSSWSCDHWAGEVIFITFKPTDWKIFQASWPLTEAQMQRILYEDFQDSCVIQRHIAEGIQGSKLLHGLDPSLTTPLPHNDMPQTMAWKLSHWELFCFYQQLACSE